MALTEQLRCQAVPGVKLSGKGLPVHDPEPGAVQGRCRIGNGVGVRESALESTTQ